ncbi:HAD family phosphatase [Bacillus sp. RG28]|uniref:HAD family phosphatase n=1 Tax=Gottfriedia endophytica TaxID=2820819 RepID=A0A940SIB5_9BACI|nr:Cof-type HAD-IIB family hydrolase [Gottfriedia endophytica]MBP0724321.1 HAD family phosphatase [Gottfriedia endophytica]
MALIAIDMDGTLISNENIITKENVESIKAAQSEGIHVVISTGRLYDSAKETLDEVGINCPIISLNGSKICDQNGNVILNKTMDKDVFSRVLAECERENNTFIISTNKGSYTKNRDELYEEFFTDKQTKKLKKLTTTLKNIRNYHSVEDFTLLDVYKILFLSNDQTTISRLRNKLAREEKLLVTSSHSNNLEINAAGISKGAALLYLAPILGVDLQQSMAIGDSFNDVSMFNRVGFPVAMGNATDELKQHCVFTTKTNNESGVAHAIYHFMELKKKISN